MWLHEYKTNTWHTEETYHYYGTFHKLIKEDATWIQQYGHFSKNQQTIFFDLLEKLGLERLIFYHTYHRLETLIEWVEAGYLTTEEAVQYDTLKNYDTFSDPCSWKVHATFDEASYKRTISRPLLHLLAGVQDNSCSTIKLTPQQQATYDLFDANPRLNSTRTSKINKDSSLGKDIIKAETYLDLFYSQIILPIAEERARLYEAWEIFLQQPGQKYDKKRILLEDKIDLFSACISELCYELKKLECEVTHEKKHKRFATLSQLGRVTLKRYQGRLLEDNTLLRKDPTYRQERRFRPKNKEELRQKIHEFKGNYYEKYQKHNITNVLPESRNYLSTFLKTTVGVFLALSTIGFACFSQTFCSYFFHNPRDHCLSEAQKKGKQLYRRCAF